MEKYQTSCTKNSSSSQSKNKKARNKVPVPSNTKQRISSDLVSNTNRSKVEIIKNMNINGDVNIDGKMNENRNVNVNVKVDGVTNKMSA